MAEENTQFESAAYDSAIFEDPVVETGEAVQDNNAEVEWPAPPLEQQASAEPQALPPALDQEPETPVLQETQSVTAPPLEPQASAEPQALPPGPPSATASARSPTEEVPSSEAASQPSLSTAPLAPSEPPLPQLPLKRPFDTMTTLLYDDSELIKVSPDDDYHTGVFGPKRKAFYEAYLASQHRKDDVPPDKLHEESDTTDSDHGGPSPGLVSAKRQLSRKELKQLDRKVPWTQILRGNNVPEYLKAIDKEANSWLEWKSVQPLSHEQARQVLNDKILCKRILRTRACYRDSQRPRPSACKVPHCLSGPPRPRPLHTQSASTDP